MRIADRVRARRMLVRLATRNYKIQLACSRYHAAKDKTKEEKAKRLLKKIAVRMHRLTMKLAEDW